MRFDLNHHVGHHGPVLEEIGLDLAGDGETIGHAEVGIDLDMDVHREFGADIAGAQSVDGSNAVDIESEPLQFAAMGLGCAGVDELIEGRSDDPEGSVENKDRDDQGADPVDDRRSMFLIKRR